jgi:hypothetical protein
MKSTKRNINKEILELFSGQKNTVTIPKFYIQITGSYAKANVLNQIIYWSNKSDADEEFFYKTYEEWTNEIHLSERTVRRYLTEFENESWILTKVKKVKGLNIKHIKPNFDKIIGSIHDYLDNDCPNRPTCLDGKKNQQVSCAIIAPTGQLDRSEPANLTASSIYTDEYIQINKPPTPLTGGNIKTQSFGFQDMISDNPHEIPEQTLKDWIIVRNKKRAPITSTAWTRLQKTLTEIKTEKGVSPIEAFETMVSSGWQSVKVEYFAKSINYEKIKLEAEDRARKIEEHSKQLAVDNFNKKNDGIVYKDLMKKLSEKSSNELNSMKRILNMKVA